jgi:hypothetical protein
METQGSDQARLERPRWRDAAIRIVAVFLVTRLLVVMVAVFLEQSIPLGYDGPSYSRAPIARSLTGEDAVYYLGIAAQGYHLQPIKENHYDWVFFPLYPVVVRAVSILTFGDVTLAGILAANLAFLAAALALYRLSLDHLGHDVAVRSVVYLAIAPGAVAFAMAYSDSLFLLLAVGAFLAAERGRWWTMGVLYGLAALTRLPGVLLGIPLFMLMVRSLGSRPRPKWLAFGLGPAAVLGFYAWLGAFTGDFLANLHAQAAWNIAPIASSGDTGGGGAAAPSVAFNPVPLLLLATLLAYTFLFLYLRRDRVAAPYVVLSLLAFATIFLSLRLQSVARYLGVAWPFSWVLASRRSAAFHEVWPIASAGLFTVHALLHFTQALAP